MQRICLRSGKKKHVINASMLVSSCDIWYINEISQLEYCLVGRSVALLTILADVCFLFPFVTTAVTYCYSFRIITFYTIKNKNLFDSYYHT